MMGSDSSRPETDAVDYFGNQKKKLDLADRRPVIRKASDLVGPGIGASAVRLTDFNDVLGTFNGYFSAAPDAANAPNDTGEFVGFVTMDSEYGGRQVFTDMEDGSDYTRIFRRAPADPETLTWGVWRRRWGATPTAVGALGWAYTSVPSGASTLLSAPAITTNGAGDLYSTGYGSGGTALDIQEQGVYTGHVTVYGPAGISVQLTVNVPSLPSATPIDHLAGALNGPLRIPFVAVNVSLVPTTLTVEAFHLAGSTQNIGWNDIQITRVGDAI